MHDAVMRKLPIEHVCSFPTQQIKCLVLTNIRGYYYSYGDDDNDDENPSTVLELVPQRPQ